jgi:predicted ATPase
MGAGVGRDAGPGQLGEYGEFMQVLRARCDVWEMEGKKDYRRLSGELDGTARETAPIEDSLATDAPAPGVSTSTIGSPDTPPPDPATKDAVLPKHYLVNPPEETLAQTLHTLTSTPASSPIPWTPTTLTVYGRPLSIPTQHAGTTLFTFPQICGTLLGPADYVTLASTYHTFIITSVPILGFLQKNEAKRFITLLDALYEARCRLLVTANAGPDEIFFPAAPPSASGTDQQTADADALYQETYSEIVQDLTSPFRPNVSSYNPSSDLPLDAIEDDPPNRARRPGSSYTDERRTSKALDFANIRGLTGEDEVFSVKRAESRLWEMCSGKWWDRAAVVSEDADAGVMDWWRPLPLESRHWERSHLLVKSHVADAERLKARVALDMEAMDDGTTEQSDRVKETFPHGASPFRTVDDAPPKIWPTHIWGLEKWGKGAGAWGKGVEGLSERKKAKEETDKRSGNADRQ